MYLRTAEVEEAPTLAGVNASSDDPCEGEATTVVDVSENGAKDVGRTAGLNQEATLERAADPGDSSSVDVDGCPSVAAKGVLPVDGQDVR